MFLYEVTTPREIELEYGLPHRSMTRDLHRGRFRKSEIRKSGATWLITKREAKRVYKSELTFIPVIDDFEWVLFHVRNELQNESFSDLVRRVLNKPFLDDNDVCRLADLYHDGLRDGIEDGKYIPFAQWFYEYFEDRILELENEEDD